jgi:hypothetical protein
MLECIASRAAKSPPQLQRRAGSYYLNPYLLVLLLPQLMPPTDGGSSWSHAHGICKSGRRANVDNDQDSRNAYGFKGMVYSNRFVSPGSISNAGLV